MQHISQTIDKYKGLTMHQFNAIKRLDLTDFSLVGDLADHDHDIVEATHDGQTIYILSTGEITN